MNRNSKTALGCLMLFFTPFAAVGVVTAVMAVRSVLANDWGQAGLRLIFALVFGGVGFGFITAALTGRKRVSELDRLRAEHPAERWRWRPEWVAGRIESSTRQKMITAGWLAGLWNLISLPSAILVIPEFMASRELPLLLVFIFPVVGVGLLVWALRIALRYKKYGISILELAHVPGVIGPAWVASSRPRSPSGRSEVSRSSWFASTDIQLARGTVARPRKKSCGKKTRR